MATTKTPKAQSILNLPTWDRINRLASDGVFPHRITSLLLWGPPGTGKSSWARYLFKDSEIVPFNEDVDIFALLGMMAPCIEDGKATLKWVDGPAARAAREGKVIILDEINKASPQIYPLLHAMTECDPSQIRIRTGDGGYIVPAPGYGVVATSNVSPDKLSEALQTRFLSCYVDRPAPGLSKSLGQGLDQFFESYYVRASQENPQSYQEPLSPRSGLKIKTLCESGYSPEDAVAMVFGGNPPRGIEDALMLVFK